MSDDAALYTYAQIYVAPTGSDDAALYTYVNVGAQFSPSVIGRVRGFAGRPLLATLYTYVNVT